MSNLITTIIGIALFAIIAVTGAYYGGQAYSNAQINATANAIINEAQQILQAERMWATNNNQPDISGMGTAGASGTGMSMLVSSKALSSWPSLGGGLGVSLTNPQQSYTPPSSAAWDNACYSTNGYMGRFVRYMFSYNNGNYVQYLFSTNLPYSAPCQTVNGSFASSNTDISQANHPIVKIAKAINAAMNQIPVNANLAAMPYVGLPQLPNNGSTNPSNVYDTSAGYAASKVFVDGNGAIQTNYCMLLGAHIACTFGPS